MPRSGAPPTRAGVGGVKLFLAVTDNDWYRFLAGRPDLDEVNFWQPGGRRAFQSLGLGEPFLFKLHAPEHAVVGGGFYTHSTLLPISLAWKTFGERNGVGSLDELRQRVGRHRRSSDPREEYTIGCVLLRDPFFFPPEDWLDPPADFKAPIVQGKTYDLTSGTGKVLWEAVRVRMRRLQVRESPSVYGDPAWVRRRLGQGTFRVLVTDAYARRCAVTGERALPVLEAAHIRPVSQGGEHRVDNGILLRADLHALFDQGYVTVTPDYRFRASQRLRRDFDNGETYLALDGTGLWLPRAAADRPGRAFLQWHAETVFRG